jgi:phospholipid/cholesterol/gamma-HCH transport system ATP-binding protein
MTKHPPKITLQNLHKSFNYNHVLKGVDLEVSEGESVVIIGGSGTGKSVLIKCIIGLLTADEGSVIKIEGIDLNKSTRKEKKQLRGKISMLFQGSALFDSIVVWENICFDLLQNRKIHRKDALDLALQRLQTVGLKEEVAQLYPSELSGGMQRRVALARAVASTPEILFCDEPTAGLDPIFCGVISELIRRHAKELGCTTITITHDMACARLVGDRIAMLYEGKLIWIGTPAELNSTDNPYVHQFVHGKSEGPIQL